MNVGYLEWRAIDKLEPEEMDELIKATSECVAWILSEKDAFLTKMASSFDVRYKVFIFHQKAISITKAFLELLEHADNLHCALIPHQKAGPFFLAICKITLQMEPLSPKDFLETAEVEEKTSNAISSIISLSQSCQDVLDLLEMAKVEVKAYTRRLERSLLEMLSKISVLLSISTLLRENYNLGVAKLTN